MMPVFENNEARKQLAAKLKDLILTATTLQPPPTDVEHEPDLWRQEDHVEGEIADLYRRAAILLGSYGFTLEAQELDRRYDYWKAEGLLWKIQDGLDQGDYASPHTLSDFLSNILYVVDPELGRPPSRHPRQVELLLHVLRRLETAFTILKSYPEDELAFERIAESVLICVFPKMRPNVAVDRELKAFRPDTGIPEANALIDYKFLREPGDVPKKVDEINADIVGFKKEGWTHFIFVVYEDQRYATTEQWEEHFRDHSDVSIVLVKGALNKPKASAASSPASAGKAGDQKSA